MCRIIKPQIIVILFSFFTSIFLSAQESDWLASDFSNSVLRGIEEINGKIYCIGTTVLVNDTLTDYELKINKIDFSGSGTGFTLKEVKSIIFSEHYSTLAIKYVAQTEVWMLLQAKYISSGYFNYRVILCDTAFNILAQQSVDAPGYPLTFHIDSDESETYMLGSLFGPVENGLVYIKYTHSRPYELPLLEIRQSEPRDMSLVTSMKVDQRTRNMLVFSYSGITVLDSNLYIVHDYNSEEVLTSDYGHVLGAGDYYYSHGARDSAWNVPLRKLVVHKYDSDFNVLKADTLGWPAQDNYPFANQSIDYRNHDILVGGILDGPFNHEHLDESIKKYYLAKYDEDLNQMWYKEYGGDRAYIFFGIHLLEGGDSFAYGTITDPSTHIHYAYLIHVDENGEILTSYIFPQGSKSLFQIVNPGGETLRILNPDHIQGRIELYDIQGCHMLTGEINENDSEINTQNLPEGLYPYVLIKDGRVIGSGKWVKAR